MLRLEALTVCGFKSFVDRTELSFRDGITGVVGPNGCGKSNVLDAIAWVLGEQSARSLRGSRMEDVIFAGSRSRKPAGMAEVSLRFSPKAPSGEAAVDVDPRLAEPLVVTRRLYRNGDSEYLVNGERSRLKDITQLIMGTGMGTRVYSIIEQGRVEQILNSKPTDRRILIEEAAGITRYKLKRKAAKLKLDEAEQSLLRVTDIVAEIERQLSSLRRQAGVARRYRRLAGRQRVVLRALYSARHRDLSDRLEAAESKLGGLRASEAEAAADLAALEDEARTARESVGALEARRDELSQQAHQIHLELDRARGLLEASRQRIAENQARSRASEKTSARVDEEVAVLVARHESSQAQLEALDRDLAAARLRVDGFGEDTRTRRERLAEAHRTIAETKEAIFEVMSESAGLRNRRAEIEAGLVRLRPHVERLAAAVGEGEQDASRLAAELQSGEEKLRRAEQAEDQLRSRVERAASRSAESAERVTVARAAADEALARLHEAEVEEAKLEEAVRVRAGTSESVRRFLEHPPEGALGTVADFAVVVAGHEKACEKALGELLESVVFSSRKAALAAARDMVTGALPGVPFVFPSEPVAAPAARTPSGPVLGPISGSVSFPEAPWISALMPHAFVAETVADAMTLAAAHPALAFVSRDGASFGPGGRGNAGRAAAAGDGVLTVKARHQAAAEEAGRARREVAARREMLAAAEEGRAEAAAEVRELQEALTTAEKGVLGSRHALIGLRQAAETAVSRARLVALEHEQAAAELVEAAGRVEEQGRALDAAVARRAELDLRLQAAVTQAEELEADVLESSSQLAQLREELAVLATRREGALADLGEAERLLAQARERAARCAEELESLRLERSETDELVLRTEEAMEAGAARWEALKNELAETETRVRDARSGLMRGGERLRELHAEHDQRSKLAADQDVRRERIQSELEHLIADCHKELSVDPREIEPPVQPAEVAPPARRRSRRTEAEAPVAAEAGDASAEDAAEPEEVDLPISEELPWVDGKLDLVALEEEADELRRKLSRIGPVNLVAIEEHDELAERHRFLTQEQADLVTSIASLRETIAEIDQMSRERFLEAFEAVKVTFDQAFQALFRGGRAELRLQDEEDPLECGIEIIAQPPGKRLQNMMLLSGGEKALTAIALLFALFRYKPSPFCILDEVDAPLDESNVLRFAEMVETLSAETQFIVITHNRRTMERAGTLYGVTMEEPGCSKLVSVRFESLEREGEAA